MKGAGESGVLDVVRRTRLYDPATLTALTGAAAVWGSSVATPYAAAAMRHPTRTAIIDDYGSLTYFQLEWRTNRIAGALKHEGIGPGSTVGLLCKNHRGFIEANIAAAKVGARLVYLNTGLPDSQLSEVLKREGISFVAADREFAERLAKIPLAVDFAIVAPEDDPDWSFPSLERWRIPLQIPRPWRRADPVLLTSGTSGAPKGTNRNAGAAALVGAVGFLEAVPFRAGDVLAIPAPLFHAWGVSQALLAGSIGGTVVLRRKFEPALVARDIKAHGVNVLIAVPVMLQRMLDAETFADPDADLSSLRITASSGSALPGDLATRWMDQFGDNLYNIYGSTEVGQVSVATPADLRRTPGTAGHPLKGVELRILDDQSKPAPPGSIGRIVIKSASLFDGYTDGNTKEVVDSHMAIGDRGFVDQHGCLNVVGRADDMIISGGENLYPINIERSLLRHPKVVEAAVVGVADDEFGQRVRAVVVPSARTGLSALTKNLGAHLSGELAPYEVPKEYVFVSELPRNVSGKVFRSQLRLAEADIPNRLTKKSGAKKSKK